jgi:hypothetical protein
MENNQTANNRVTAIFASSKDADEAYDSLIQRGYTKEEISVVMTEATHQRFRNESNGNTTHAADDAGRGALLGGATGGIVAAIAAISTNLALPGLGLVLVGPVLAGLAGAAAGGVVGGTIGAIVGNGYPKEEADYYETSIKEGGIMISITPQHLADKDFIIEDFKKHNGQRIYADDRSVLF